MKPLATAALCLTLTTALLAQTTARTTFTDPANLRGERVKPRDGRELPIDGGPTASGQPDTALALQQLLRRLNTRASILNIVAHPDDEDGGMLTLYSRGLGARVADLSLTRGEGGQNAVTGDFEDALGLLRTQELLANDRYTGVDQFFGTEVDFGFSKTKSEAFSKWTHDRVLYDTVRAIRLYRPLVITSTWTGGVTDGHGQHQAAGQIAQEAFLAAGDPKIFPELTAEGILPWQPLRIYARVPQQAITPQGLFDYATNQYVPAEFTNYVTGITTTTPPSTDILVHEGTRDPLLTPAAANPADLPSTYLPKTHNSDPKTGSTTPATATPFTYVQFARIGLGLQRSQIPANFRIPPAGTFDVPYHLYGSAAQAPTARPMPARGGPGPQRAVFARWGGEAPRPARNGDQRAEGPTYSPAQETDPTFFTGIDTSIEGIGSVTVAPFPPLQSILHGLSQRMRAITNDFDPAHPAAIAPQLAAALKATDAAMPAIQDFQLEVPFARESILHELLIKRIQLEEALALSLGLELDATTSLSNVPKGSPLRIDLSAKQIPHQARAIPTLRSQHGNVDIFIDFFDGPDPVNPAPIATDVTIPARSAPDLTEPYFYRDNIEQPVYKLRDPALRNAPGTPAPIVAWNRYTYNDIAFSLARIVHAGPQSVNIVPATPATYESIGYGDLPRTIYYPRPKPQLHNIDLTLPTHHHLAYLPGTGDAVPEALASIGLASTILTVADLTPANLAQYDTVILGVRTYAAHPDLHGAPTQALLTYAKSGGNVVVQYQTAEFTAADAPYPLNLGPSAEKVVDETDPVELLLSPQTLSPLSCTGPACLLVRPNRITPADFDNWVEERGHGFLSTWDPRYTALTSVHDPGAPSEHILPQQPQRGGLITTQLGQGRWTYVAFALYRQLPEAVPGAFRLFANLLQK
jgi:LmbE family N-acetylglucosaminyl deacetylase